MENATENAMETRRYHPLLVSLHWLIALIVLSQALVGVGILHFWPNNAIKATPLALHMILGMMMLVLLLIMIIARFLLPRPASPNVVNPFLHFVSTATHMLLYVVALLMGVTGILLALRSHVLQLVVGGRVSYPMHFALFLHAVVFVMFGLLVGFHVLGALYHQFVRRDRPFSRMGFAARSVQARKLEAARRPAGSL